MFDGYPVVIVRGLELEVAIIQMTWGAKELLRGSQPHDSS